VLGDEERAIVQRACAARLPDCDFLFHIDGKPLGPMLSEVRRTCKLLDISLAAPAASSSTTPDTP
jgi:hypothetical protein